MGSVSQSCIHSPQHAKRTASAFANGSKTFCRAWQAQPRPNSTTSCPIAGNRQNNSPKSRNHAAARRQTCSWLGAYFPIAPWNRFNHNTLTLRTTDPTHRIAEENTQSPHRDELKQTFRQCIIAGRCCSADTANRFAIGSSLYFHDNGIFLFVKFRFPDTKAFEFQTVVEYSFQAHGSS